jgi:hypothetical protein
MRPFHPPPPAPAGVSPPRPPTPLGGFVGNLYQLGRGLHSLTSELNFSAFYWIGGARRGCVTHVQGVFRVCRVFLCVRHGSS